ncbi:MAG: nitrous oxide reductase accessory protein NosL [Rhodocyclaceae bacterium]|jgi:nitrous oxide reductase accessory protein NosL|nr:nitrous oxide reductase accessory protein NosL [Rhodocyclaceae bacterium]
MDRREALKLSLLAGAGMAVGTRPAQAAVCEGDGTPMQFVPKKPADPQPQVNDIEKYPKCPYCGMDRRQYHHSRMLIQYSDDLPDGTCSLHCAAISLSLNIDREPKMIWVGDNAAAGEPKPLVEVDKATFLVGSKIPGVMTARSKVAYGSEEAAKAAQAANGGELVKFDDALLAAYTDMAKDVSRIRKMRAERRKKMMEQQQAQPMEHKH